MSTLYYIMENEEDDSKCRVTKMEYPNIERIISYLKSQMGVYHFTPKEKNCIILSDVARKERTTITSKDAQISIKPYNIQPYATPPKDMIEHYHFEEL